MSATIHSLAEARARRVRRLQRVPVQPRRERRPCVRFDWRPAPSALICTGCDGDIWPRERCWLWTDRAGQLWGTCADCGPAGAIESARADAAVEESAP